MPRRLLFYLEFTLILTLSLAAHSQNAQETTIYTFTNGTDGATPLAGLAFGPNGSLFGVTNFGGTFNSDCVRGCGTTFQLTPASGGTWNFETIHNFAGGTGDYGHPQGRAAFDSAGNLWGTAFLWGPGELGGVFELSATDNWNESLIYSFYVTTSTQPAAGLTAHEGSWYGTTQFGRGIINNGTIFSLTSAGNDQWNESVLHAFSGGEDGFEPQTELVFDQKGNIYGTTPYGGPQGAGDIFELTPVAGGQWKETIIYEFPSYALGGSYYPSTLILDAHGNLYGTTTYGGANCDTGLGCGTVFELKRVGNTWQETTLYEFAGGADGEVPRAGLVSDGHGNLYGTTQFGGTGSSCPLGQFPPGCGTVFKLSKSRGAWQKSTLYSFTGGADGGFPQGALVLDTAGNLYGVTVGNESSVSQYGTVFEIQP